ncbi:hypothetical protein MMC28_008766 [Mycoblastus sanguinarius]|nr:hypothetical protein [Mycoblastus sanguinarius]
MIQVMHPKFVIIDRQRALLPSCNLSYESWLECCLSVHGPIVASLTEFWHQFWGRNDFPDLPTSPSPEATASTHSAMLLPSPHHRSPRFRPFLNYALPPSTPLNTAILHLISTASRSITLLTPNLTSPPVISALLEAIKRGVDITIITNRRMMVLEQILTAGTITEICVWKLRRQYSKLLTSRGQRPSKARISQEDQSSPTAIEEGRQTPVGALNVGYLIPSATYAKTHIKCTIIDEQIIILGSGNMDRASWYTSQELGLAVESADVVKGVWGHLEREMGERMTGVEWL